MISRKARWNRDRDSAKSREQTILKVEMIKNSPTMIGKLYHHEYEWYLDALANMNDLTIERQAKVANLFKRITGRNFA